MIYPQQNWANSVNSGYNLETRMHNPGSIVGERYQILQQLGRGGFGQTYLAQDIQTPGSPRCVIKQLQPKLTQPQAWQEAKKRFIKEASVQQRLGNHNQIPHVLAHFAEGQEFYLVQEFIDGEELRDIIGKQLFNETEVIALLQDILRVLIFVHKNDVIHRDIKPSNIIYRRSDQKFVLIDFGAVKEINTLVNDERGNTILTQTIGTRGFMPPEQITGRPSFSSDIYALGQTAIYAITGQSPLSWEEDDNGSQTSWQNYCQISSKLAAIIRKMIAVRSIERYHSALEVIYDLHPLTIIGQTVGERYRLIRYLGGKSGIYTYLAENLWRKYQSPCILKQIKLHVGDPSTLQAAERRFSSELPILERLGYHDQIPKLLDHFEANEEFYLVQEYINGESLEQKLDKNHHLSEKVVISLLQNTLSVLAFIHQHRVIHRNIKPSNLIIRNSDEKVVLIDFGVLREIASLTATTTFAPVETTKAYMPPEQIAGRPNISSDLYALGITTIQCLTGKHPDKFPRNEQTGEIVWREGLEINRKLAKIIDKMVCLDVGKRYHSAELILGELNKLSPDSTSYIPSHSSGYDGGRIVYSGQGSSSDETSLPGNKKIELIQIAIAIAGMISLMASLEFFSPTVRPLYYWNQGKQTLPENPEIALQKFQQAIDIQPKQARSWQGRGDALFRLERFDEALAAYEEAIELDSNNFQAWKGRGDALYRLERFTAALTAYKKALQLEPANAATLNRKGRALYKLENYQEALLAQEEALKIDPDNAQYLSDLGTALIGLGKYAEALMAYNRAQVSEPLNPQLWQNKALALQYLGRPQEANRVYQEALRTYDRVLKDEPKNTIAWIDRGNVLSKLRRFDEAVNSYQRAIKIKPDSHLAWVGKANALFSLGGHQEALSDLEKALEVKPDSYIIWHNKGSLLKDGLKDALRAVNAYDKAIGINPNFYPAWRDRGFALIQNNPSEAIKSFRRAITIKSTDYRSWVGQGIALSSLNRIDESLAAFERAQSIQPQDPFVWMNKGTALEKAQKYHEACNAYREVTKIAPDFPAAINAMARLGCRRN
ncbi:MAG: tetratricopeptide repeat protein [Xenococcaceae cyanobacterium MO_188.B29]|nr:tetratricopeptide repeat protein [Xenococcaceae cyanobacterium MO_188.B29]